MDLAEELRLDVENLIKKLMIEESVEQYDIQFEGKCEPGDNYAGEILFYKVIPKGDKEPYNLVVKTAKRTKDLNKWLPIDMIYNREIFMYDKVFPRFRKLIEETSSGLLLNFVPKIYSVSHASSKQTIIFENLKTRGFQLHDRKKPWDLDHSLLAMKSYGRFHALSMALRDQNPDEYNKLTEQMPCVAKEFNKNFNLKSYVIPCLNNILRLLKDMGRDDLLKKYESFIDIHLEQYMNHEVEDEADKLVIGHVDCWNNNFMFEYQEDNDSKPKSIYLLDFQLSIPCSPVKDLSYNIYTTCDKSCLAHFDLLLKTYHTSLSQTLESLGSKHENLFTLDQLKEHWKKYAKYGLLTSLIILKICLVEKEDVLDFTEISEKSKTFEDFSQSLNVEVKNVDEYNRRNLDVFIHFGENFL